MLAVSFCLIFQGLLCLCTKLESRLKHSQEGPPTLGGLSFTIVLLQKPRPCDCPWAPVSSTGQRIRQPLASICLQLSFPIVFLYSEVCGWPKVFALLSPVFGLHWLEGSFFACPSFACLVVHLSRHICDGRLWNVNQQLSGSQFLQVMAC